MFAAVVLATLTSVFAGDFLEARSDSDHIQESDLKDFLLSELYNADSNPEVQMILRYVQPMYKALPKNPYGRLDSPTVRYAVHRYFVQRYGWYISGLDPKGGARNTSFSLGIMKERASTFIERLFDEILGDQGFGVQDLAVFAATVAELIHKEAAMRLDEIHDAFKLGHRISHQESELAIKVYFAEFLLGAQVRSMKAVRIIDANMWSVYPDWDNTLMWVKDMRSDFAWVLRDARNPFVSADQTYEENARLLHNIKEHYNSYQNLECQHLKSSLVEMEHEGTGRVRLNNFYSGGMGGDWKFTESVEFLRNLGALDETDPERPTVVIPNYVLSSTNCMSSSKFYSVCCADECETLMLSLETSLAKPAASAAEIASRVSVLASDTVAAPRNLSSVLVSRLHAIANLHEGSVPLHGRLFAQWMHHAFPRECPFPHEAGTIKPITPDEFIHHFGTVEATMTEMVKHNQTQYEDRVLNVPAADTLPWTMVEELVSSHEFDSNKKPTAWTALRPIMAVVALASVVSSLVRAWKKAASVKSACPDRVLV